ncbi:hypothetical protein EIN_428070 [Entamoeba invadens IP1]|uniref:Uncharacterized protein n=1 Tax=Entamoeba invadens IP1 TaxID=370355 RepID=A0A0A1UEV6_ENTIV|nr:hypothetical protein EIN_428070 [Entamoeba invadens IP1]ELP95131.1 hypothetical protein EIN_428070 [Entamoeba invadens IP1]|eukprot:XP_004261902.1 hypothetical protein EIN_428070 [Entamoeba invadens IP1]
MEYDLTNIKTKNGTGPRIIPRQSRLFAASFEDLHDFVRPPIPCIKEELKKAQNLTLNLEIVDNINQKGNEHIMSEEAKNQNERQNASITKAEMISPKSPRSPRGAVLPQIDASKITKNDLPILQAKKHKKAVRSSQILTDKFFSNNSQSNPNK